MKVIDKRQKQSKKELDLSPGSIIEDEDGIWLIHINEDDSKAVSCIKAFFAAWLTSEIVLTHVSDKELMSWFDADAHNLKNAKLVIE
ncbi:hypothetical protein [Lactobacillus gasseri]|jgi:hypothetical protein|uniref:hypothetical protein n=1 Tax=Lactobacillus gasseri TaxID=1596 RepID=UPI0007EF0247|nr:hypothetical protein [Lactobacillus gasseri]MCT7894616.1 hypothetical protein [Lactobacillus gasseri]MDK6499544.1 hypothetical protein [Lactobacillus gasseri]MDK7168437.1 hypothetical protein [Lactobacillus gasseri]